MVLHDMCPSYDREKICTYWRQNISEDTVPHSFGSGKDSISFDVDGISVVLAPISVPIPSEDYHESAASSVLWPNAESALNTHKAHTILTVSGERSRVDLSTILTQVTATVLSTCRSSLGVFWCNSVKFIRKDIAIAIAEEVMPVEPPMDLWVDLNVCYADGSSKGYTKGLDELDLMDFEVLSAPLSKKELYQRLLDYSYYLVDNGLVIKDGNTIGSNEKEKILCVYAKSVFAEDKEVIQLNFNEPDKKIPFWKFWRK
jgi:hypothetical protein